MRMLPMDIEKNLEKVIDALSNSKNLLVVQLPSHLKMTFQIFLKNLTQEAKKIGAIN